MRYILVILFLNNMFLSFTQEKKIKAYLDTKEFYAPGAGNYLEIYLQFVGPSVKYVSTNDGLQARVSLSFEVLKNDSVIKSDAYILESPLIKDSIIDDFYEVNRVVLEAGEYDLRIELTDLNDPKSKTGGKQKVKIDDFTISPSISDIEVAEYAYESDLENNFVKSGFHIIPLISNFYPSDLTKIPFYFEVYNSDKIGDSIVGIIQKIINEDTDMELEDFSSFTRTKPAAVIPFFKKLDISKLPSGNYRMDLILTDRKLNPIAKNSYSFQRSNDLEIEFNPENIVLDPAFQNTIAEDSVFYYLESLIPIAKPAEIKNIITTYKTKDRQKSRKHIQAFWVQTSGKDSYNAWIKYKMQVQQAERMYHTNYQQGFETDRGRVFLKYGAPNNIVSKETSPSEYPYEIWTFNKIGKFSNRRFVFYNPDLVNNAYRLLHSDMWGELKNPAWQQTLNKRNTVNGDVDNPNKFNEDHWGGNSNDYFRQY
ncbi:MAG: GWxTD domain-containing protein [Bacteroidota bacterium]